jgi:hypothetical protein
MGLLVDKDLRCIAYDQRVHCRSDESAGGYEFDPLAPRSTVLLPSLILDDLEMRNLAVQSFC